MANQLQSRNNAISEAQKISNLFLNIKYVCTLKMYIYTNKCYTILVSFVKRIAYNQRLKKKKNLKFNVVYAF